MLRVLPPVLLAAVAFGQSPASRVADINQTPIPSSHPDTPWFGAQVASGRWVFAATNGSVGDELWSVSSTGTGPVLVRDLDVGTWGSIPRHFVSLGGVVLFTAREEDSGYELWRTDGTWAGTWMVRDIQPGPASALIIDTPLSLYQGFVWFAADDGISGRELWRTDGTAAGTVMVVDIEPGAAGSGPSNFTLLGSQMYFTASTAVAGNELWKTLGTPASTVLVRDIDPAGSSSPAQLTAVGTRLYFTASLAGDRELWRSDGTFATTIRALDVSTTGSSDPLELTPLGSVLLFTATTAANGRELWRSNGTAAGTYMVRDIVPGSVGGGPISLVVAGTDVWFSAYDTANGQELWKSDGTTAGTALVADLWPGLNNGQPASSSPRELAVAASAHGSFVYFSANDGTLGQELWRVSTAGPFFNPVLVHDLVPGAVGSYPKGLFVIPSGTGIVMFQAGDELFGEGLGRTQGTAATTSLTDLDPPRSSSGGGQFATIGGLTYFAGDDGVNGRELWVTDGTAAGTSMVADILPGPGSSVPSFLTAWNGVLYFTAYESTGGAEIWRSNGLFGGTVRVLDIYPGPNGSGPTEYTVVGNRLYFAALHPSYGREVWKTDGTPAGTVLAIDLEPGPTASSPFELTAFGPWLVFAGRTLAEGAELRRSDGTAAGTTLIADLIPGPDSGSAGEVTVVGDFLFFRAYSTVSGGDLGVELWRSDGTTAGTTLVADLWPGPGHSIPQFLTPVEFTPGVMSLCFAATTPTQGTELFCTDGTAAGTLQLRDIRPGVLGSHPQALTRVRRPFVGDLLVFSAVDGSTGREPWRSDGTMAGTIQLVDHVPGFGSSIPSAYGWSFSPPGAQQLLFAADDGSNGVELMRHDLVAGTTTLHQDIHPGYRLGSNPMRPVLIGNRLWFAASDASGGDPWVMASMALAESFGTGCAGGSGLVPALQAIAAPYLGNAAFGYRLTGAPPNTLAFALVDFVRSNQPFGACTLLVQPLLVTILVADAAGTAIYPVPLPQDPAFLGLTLDCQGLVYDPPAPVSGLLSASNGVEALLGPN